MKDACGRPGTVGWFWVEKSAEGREMILLTKMVVSGGEGRSQQAGSSS